MSMMADLAASEGLGYGQALTASEMAINAGSKTCLLLRLPLLIVCQLLKSSKKCIYIYIYKFLRFGAINDTSDVPISVVSRLSFRCCLFSGLAMGPSMATLALAANWNYFEISLTGAACALLSAALSAFALRDVPHASGTWEKAKRKHHRRTDAQINVEDKGKRVQTHPKHVFIQKNTFPKTKKHKHNNLRICISKKKYIKKTLICRADFFEASRGPETMPSSGSCTSRSRETRTQKETRNENKSAKNSDVSMILTCFFVFCWFCLFFVGFFVISWFSQAAADESVFVGAGRSEMARLGCLSL